MCKNKSVVSSAGTNDTFISKEEHVRCKKQMPLWLEALGKISYSYHEYVHNKSYWNHPLFEGLYNHCSHWNAAFFQKSVCFCCYLRQIITYASIVCFSVPTKYFVLGTLNYKDEETKPSFWGYWQLLVRLTNMFKIIDNPWLEISNLICPRDAG